jgi:hypothetical protein
LLSKLLSNPKLLSNFSASERGKLLKFEDLSPTPGT